jgi:hypothetical protein
MGRIITTKRKTMPIIATWFYFLTKKEGRAIPTLNEPAPSGFPYFKHFYLAYSSVRHS